MGRRRTRTRRRRSSCPVHAEVLRSEAGPRSAGPTTIGTWTATQAPAMDFSLSDDQRAIRDGVGSRGAQLRRRLLAGARRGRRIPARVPPRDGRGRLAGHHHAGGVRRRRPGRDRGGDHDARGGQPRRRHGRGLHGAHQPVRPAPDRGVRHAGAEGALAAAAGAGAGPVPSASPSPTPASTPPPSRPSRSKVDGGYLVNGQKIWTSTAQVANKIMLLTRTTRLEDCARPTDGITIFYTDLDRSKIEVHRIAKMGRKAVDSNAIFIDDLFIPEADRIGEEGKGFNYLLHSLNPERLLIGAEAIGHRPGRAAPRREVRQRARRLRPADRPEPGHPAPAGGALDGAGSRLGDGDEGRLAVRPAAALRRRGQRRQVPGRARRLREPASRRC